MENNNELIIDENLMNDEQFLEHQMRLARVNEFEDMDLDNLEDDGDFEADAMNPNDQQNRQIVNQNPNQIAIQGGDQRQIGLGRNQAGDLGANRPENPVAVRDNRAGDGDVPQNNNEDGHQGLGFGNDEGGNQVGYQRHNPPNNHVGNARNAQVLNQGVGRGHQVRIQGVYQAHNNAVARNRNQAHVQRNVGVENIAQPRPFVHQAVLQAYPQGHAVFAHQRPTSSRRQRLLTPLEAVRANRLRGIIENLQFQLQRNRDIYKSLYGPLPGNLNHDAGYWKNRFFQEKKRNANNGRNLYFFKN